MNNHKRGPQTARPLATAQEVLVDVSSARAWSCGGNGHGAAPLVSLRASIASAPTVGATSTTIGAAPWASAAIGGSARSTCSDTEPSQSLELQSTDWEPNGVEVAAGVRGWR